MSWAIILGTTSLCLSPSRDIIVANKSCVQCTHEWDPGISSGAVCVRVQGMSLAWFLVYEWSWPGGGVVMMSEQCTPHCGQYRCALPRGIVNYQEPLYFGALCLLLLGILDAICWANTMMSSTWCFKNVLGCWYLIYNDFPHKYLAGILWQLLHSSTRKGLGTLKFRFLLNLTKL